MAEEQGRTTIATVTYQQLLEQNNLLRELLKQHGVNAGAKPPAEVQQEERPKPPAPAAAAASSNSAEAEEPLLLAERPNRRRGTKRASCALDAGFVQRVVQGFDGQEENKRGAPLVEVQHKNGDKPDLLSPTKKRKTGAFSFAALHPAKPVASASSSSSSSSSSTTKQQSVSELRRAMQKKWGDIAQAAMKHGDGGQFTIEHPISADDFYALFRGSMDSAVARTMRTRLLKKGVAKKAPAPASMELDDDDDEAAGDSDGENSGPRQSRATSVSFRTPKKTATSTKKTAAPRGAMSERKVGSRRSSVSMSSSSSSSAVKKTKAKKKAGVKKKKDGSCTVSVIINEHAKLDRLLGRRATFKPHDGGPGGMLVRVPCVVSYDSKTGSLKTVARYAPGLKYKNGVTVPCREARALPFILSERTKSARKKNGGKQGKAKGWRAVGTADLTEVVSAMNARLEASIQAAQAHAPNARRGQWSEPCMCAACQNGEAHGAY